MRKNGTGIDKFDTDADSDPDPDCVNIFYGRHYPFIACIGRGITIAHTAAAYYSLPFFIYHIVVLIPLKACLGEGIL